MDWKAVLSIAIGLAGLLVTVIAGLRGDIRDLQHDIVMVNKAVSSLEVRVGVLEHQVWARETPGKASVGGSTPRDQRDGPYWAR